MKTVAQVARDLELTPSAVSNWVKQARAEPPGRRIGPLHDADSLARWPASAPKSTRGASEPGCR
jgi:transposase-like protein